MNISSLRQKYHQRICSEMIRIRHGSTKGDYPNFADGSSNQSIKYAWGILDRLSCERNYDILDGQTVGTRFETITRDFVKAAFSYLQHIRPGEFDYSVHTNIAEFAQYEHLTYISDAFKKNAILASAFGGDYVVRPDIVIGKKPMSDEQIDKLGILSDSAVQHAKYTTLRHSNSPHPILHAIISCKWTIRTDRAQNTRTEVLNLIRNRKGHLPHIVAITAEPWPARIAALALGTGDLDCVYHFALTELVEAVEETKNDDGIEALQIMINGKRLRDVSDLPFDLAV
ncbi:MAG TPA: NgoMIV family type II restriction endonuclease [Anaerolineae bacterium]|nr:NgoMIV family type II restriction endonuclease [Anaerolineae bacterium]